MRLKEQKRHRKHLNKAGFVEENRSLKYSRSEFLSKKLKINDSILNQSHITQRKDYKYIDKTINTMSITHYQLFIMMIEMF